MLNVLRAGLCLLPHAINVGAGIANIFRGNKKQKEEEDRRERVNKALEYKIREIDEEKYQLEEINKEYTKKIKNLERMLKDNIAQIEEAKRQNIEKEKQLLEKEQEEQKKKMKQMEEERLAIEKCKESLENEFTESVIEIVQHFYEEEKKWIDSIQSPEFEEKIISLKEKLNLLFEKLFEYENIIEKINNKFINIIKNSFNPKELEKMNFMVIGTSGVGKSTLINEIFGEILAKEGTGTRTTLDTKKYESKLVPFLSLLDTMGTEIGSGHKLSDVLKETLEEIMKKLDSNDPNEHIHCILYCTTSNRFFKDELKVILKLREKYDGKKLPIVIVYTRATKQNEVESIKETINNFLKENGESLSNDIFGITFITVNSREEEIDNFGSKIISPCFGLSTLIKTCFRKGEKSYRFAIKNSLIQIGQKTIKEYLDLISEQFANNIDFFNYLNVQFEPNFSNYIAYCFEKITDINKQKGFKKKEIDELKKYLEQNHINNENNEYNEFGKINDNNDIKNNNIINLNLHEELSSQNYINDNQINEGNNYSNTKCMICQNNLKIPYYCKNCNYKVCEHCYLNKLDQEESYQCDNCGEEEFEMEDEKNKNEEENINEGDDNNKINDKNNNENNINLNLDYINSSTDFNEYLKNLEKTEGKKLSKNLCMRCNNPPINPLQCEKCKYKICNKCYLEMLQVQGLYRCENCEFNEFGEAKEEVNEENDEFEGDDNNSGIFNNNLNIESKYAIKNYIDEFKNELIEEFNKNFDEFANKAADDIYLKVVEKYIYLADNQNIRMEKMKTKKELRAEAIEEINNTLKERAQKTFLAKFASQFFQDIVLIFKAKCEDKLNKFINDILNNEQANEFFKSCDALNENKKLKFENELEEYIEKLEKKETDSLNRALNSSGNSSVSCPGGCSSSEFSSCPSQSQGYC